MNETQASFSFMITLANIFGIFPVSNEKIAGRKRLCFKWMSFKVVYCLAIFCFSVANLILEILLIANENSNFARIGEFIINLNHETYKNRKCML